MASRAMVSGTGVARSGAGAVRDLRDHLTAVVVTACLTDVMGQLELATVRALGQIDGPQAMVRPTHVAPGFRDLLSRYGHSSKPRSTRVPSPRVLLLQLPQRGKRRGRAMRRAHTHMGWQRVGVESRAGGARIRIQRQPEFLGERLAQVDGAVDHRLDLVLVVAQDLEAVRLEAHRRARAVAPLD